MLYRLAYVQHELKRLVNNQMDIAQRIESIETRLEVNTISNTSNNCNNTSSLRGRPGRNETYTTLKRWRCIPYRRRRGSWQVA